MEYATCSRAALTPIPSEEYGHGEMPGIKADLSLNTNPLGASPRALKRLAHMDARFLSHYYNNSVLVSRLAAICKTKTTQIILGDGADGCLEMVAKTFIEPNDTVLIPVPTFHRYEFHTRIMGGTPVFLEGEISASFADNLAVKYPNAKIIFLCSPGNPTGVEIPKEIIATIANRFKGIVVVDEALSDCDGNGAASLIEQHPNIVAIHSFSKKRGLASARIGYLVASNDISAIIRKVGSPFKVNGLAQEMAIATLDDTNHLQRSKEFINRERASLINGLRQLGIDCTDSVTSNFLMETSKIAPSATEAEALLKEQGILVTGPAAFHLKHHVRVSVATAPENDLFLKTIARLVQRQ